MRLYCPCSLRFDTLALSYSRCVASGSRADRRPHRGDRDPRDHRRLRGALRHREHREAERTNTRGRHRADRLVRRARRRPDRPDRRRDQRVRRARRHMGGPPGGAQAANGAAMVAAAPKFTAMAPGSKLGARRDVRSPRAGQRDREATPFDERISAATAEDKKRRRRRRARRSTRCSPSWRSRLLAVDLDGAQSSGSTSSTCSVAHASRGGAAVDRVPAAARRRSSGSCSSSSIRRRDRPASADSLALALALYGVGDTRRIAGSALALIVAGIAAFCVDLRFASLGAFTAGGSSRSIAGSLLLFPSPYLSVSPWILAFGIICMMVFMVGAMTRVLRDLRADRARRARGQGRPPASRRRRSRVRPEDKIAELGLTLPTPTPPVAAYVPAVRSGNLVFISGQGPVAGRAFIARARSAARSDVEEADEAARVTCLNGLAALKGRGRRAVSKVDARREADRVREQRAGIRSAARRRRTARRSSCKRSSAKRDVTRVPPSGWPSSRSGCRVEIEFVFEVL